MKTKLTLIILCFLSWNVLFSQENGKSDKILKKADENFDKLAYIDAQKIYLDVANSGYQSENLLKRLADSYYFNNDLKNALKWYDQLYKSYQKLDKDHYFRYAMTLKNAQRYKESDAMIKEYQSLAGKLSTDNVSITKNEEYYLDIIEKNSGRYQIGATNINSDAYDYSPSYYRDKLVFTSNRLRDVKQTKIDSWTNKPYFDLYVTSLDDNQDTSKEVTVFSKKVNSTFHDSSTTFTRDGNTMYFTRNGFSEKEFKKNKNKLNKLKIYKSTKNTDGRWSKPMELSFNNDSYSCAHPALNVDETKLYFSSDLPGTYGESDIFYVTINEDGTYGTPQNLGENINTKARETFPFISSKNLLFFSSDGHQGLGGLDVFVSEINETTHSFGDAMNIGKPINSSSDDISFIINDDTQTGFFATTREGGVGGDDIYRFKQLQEPITGCKQYVNGLVTDENTKAPLTDVKVELYDENLQLLQSVKTNNEGKYSFIVDCNKNYNVRVSVNGFESSETPIYTDTNFEKNNPLDLSMQAGEELGVIFVKKGDDLGKLLQLDPIYFDFNKSNIRPDAQVELQKIAILLRNHPEMQIDVRSHTDSRGSADYNLKLSNDRAVSTVAYLKNQGITNVITGKGYGDTQLVNNCYSGVDCTEEEHQNNRRSEFILLNGYDNVDSIRAEYESTIVENPVINYNTNSNVSSNSSSINNANIISSNNGYYGFNDYDTTIFTVQIGAFKKNNPNRFNNVNEVFYHQYNDGVIRYFSGVYYSREEAESYKESLKANNIDGFVVTLQGENRN